MLLETNEVDDVNKASETVCALKIEASPTHYQSPTVSLQKLLPNTASNDIQQHVNSANSGDVQGL